MNVEGVIIRITPYKEHGAMVNLLTKDDLLAFYARNIYKIDDKNILLTSPLMYGEFTFSDHKAQLSFKEMIPVIDTRVYMRDFNKLVALNFINEVTLQLFSGDDINLVYPYLTSVIRLLKNHDPLTLIITFLAVALKLTGYALNVDSCVLTNTKLDIVGVSYQDGGLISRGAYRKSRHKLYSPNKINILRSVFKVKVNDIDKLNFPHHDAHEVLNDLLIYTYDQTGIRFKSEKLIEKIV